MLNLLTRHARWLDLWLHKHFGRPYEAILATGLGLGIIASATTLTHLIGAGGAQSDVAKTIGVGVFQAALLVNQLAQLDQHRARRRRRRARAKARVAAAVPER